MKVENVTYARYRVHLVPTPYHIRGGCGLLYVCHYRYQALKSRAAKSQGSIGTASTLLLAVLAALGTQLLTAPLDVTSTHAQLCRLPLRTIFMRILRTEGLLPARQLRLLDRLPAALRRRGPFM